MRYYYVHGSIHHPTFQAPLSCVESVGGEQTPVEAFATIQKKLARDHAVAIVAIQIDTFTLIPWTEP